MNAHKGTVSQAFAACGPYWPATTWMFECPGCSRYLTDNGWRDALAFGIAHYRATAEGRQDATTAEQSHADFRIGWPE